MRIDDSVRQEILGSVPGLRAFAISLCGNVDRADDLVQEALLRANQDLELRVAERTAALTIAHRGVQENEERLRMAMDVAQIAVSVGP